MVGRPFVKGNPGGPGRPKREVERRYLKALIGAVPIREWKEIVRRAVEDAKQGDGVARNWLSKHLCGDDPLSLIEIVEELRAEVENMKHGRNGTLARSARLAGGSASPVRE
jgi:hypothetical protein